MSPYRRRPHSLRRFRYCACSLLAALLTSLAALAQPSGQTPPSPPRPLSRSVEILGAGDAEGWRPTHAAIAGRRVAMVTAPLDPPAAAPGTVWLWDPDREPPRIRVADDAPVGLPTWWGHMHYKAGAVALTSKYLVYCAETGFYDALRIRPLADLSSHRDVFFTQPGDDAMESGIEVPYSCTNVAAENRDEEGVAFIVSRKVGMRELHHIGYLRLPEGEVEILGRSAGWRKLDPENPYPFHRGPQTHDGAVAWLWGGHLDAEATMRFRAAGTGSRVRQLDGSVYLAAGIERPVQISLWGARIAFEAGNDREEAFAGVALWDTSEDTVRPLVAGAVGPSLWGDVLLVSLPEGIFKLDLAAPDPAASAVQLTANDAGAGAYGHSAAHLGGDGLFVYLRMTGDGGAESSVWLASLWRADANLDGRVDGEDLAWLEAGRNEADFNRDGRVDRADWQVLDAEWGAAGTTGRPRGGAPEPAWGRGSTSGR